MSAFMLTSKPWSIAAQGMFQLREINQMEREMCQYLERGHGQEEFPSPPTTNPFPPSPAAHTPHIAPATQCAFSHCSSRASSNHPLFVSAFMLASKPWSIAAQGMPQLHEINQMEREMCQYLILLTRLTFFLHHRQPLLLPQIPSLLLQPLWHLCLHMAIVILHHQSLLLLYTLPDPPSATPSHFLPPSVTFTLCTRQVVWRIALLIIGVHHDDKSIT
ncbi:hypothetical protein F4604DRAFT_1932784 [Suillus subluteus]|nr:hypothetical protein F4604DRAFT_1932784 [Suillus subluteus]